MFEFHFDDIVEVSNEDVLEKKYDKVSRIAAQNQDGDVDILLEVNSELYPIKKEEKLRMVLSQTLHADGSAVASYFPKDKHKSLADKFEYVMHGLTYKMTLDPKDTGGGLKVEVYISFGGLQLMLKGPVEKMAKFKVAELQASYLVLFDHEISPCRLRGKNRARSMHGTIPGEHSEIVNTQLNKAEWRISPCLASQYAKGEIKKITNLEDDHPYIPDAPTQPGNGTDKCCLGF